MEYENNKTQQKQLNQNNNKTNGNEFGKKKTTTAKSNERNSGLEVISRKIS